MEEEDGGMKLRSSGVRGRWGMAGQGRTTWEGPLGETWTWVGDGMEAGGGKEGQTARVKVKCVFDCPDCITSWLQSDPPELYPDYSDSVRRAKYRYIAQLWAVAWGARAATV